MPQTEQLYTLAEVAAITGFSVYSILKDCEEGRVRFTKRGGSKRVHKRMTADQIEELRQSRIVKAERAEPLDDVQAVIAATRAAQKHTRRSAGRRRIAA